VLKRRLSGVAAFVAALAAGVATAIAVGGPQVTPSATVLKVTSNGGGVSLTLRAGFRLPKHAKCTGKLVISVQTPGHSAVRKSSRLHPAKGKCAARFSLQLAGAKPGQSIPFKLKYQGKGGFRLHNKPLHVVLGTPQVTSTTPTGTTPILATVPITTTPGTQTETTPTTTTGANLDGTYEGSVTSTAGGFTVTSPDSIYLSNGLGSMQSNTPNLEFACSDGIARNQSAYDASLTLHVTTSGSGGTFTGQDSGEPASNYTFTDALGGSVSVNGTQTTGQITVSETYTNAAIALTCAGTGTGTISK
jgi:hypothetical protein